MKMKKSSILVIVLLIFILICFDKFGKGIFENSIVEETAVEEKNIETNEEANEAYVSYYLIEEQNTELGRNPLQEESIIQTAEERKTDLSRNISQEEPITQTTEIDSLKVTSSAARILTNDLCVGLAKEIFDATNAERIKAGVEPLIWDDELAKPANIRAEEIITNFSHTRADGTKCYVLSDLIWGENIAKGPHANGEEFLSHWMASEGHKRNLLRPEYKTIGVGFTCTEQGDTAVQLFGVDVTE